MKTGVAPCFLVWLNMTSSQGETCFWQFLFGRCVLYSDLSELLAQFCMWMFNESKILSNFRTDGSCELKHWT